MSYRHVLELLGAAGLVATVGFLARYTWTVRWFRTAIGQHMWWFSLLNAEFFGLWAWSVWAGPKLPAERVITVGFMAQFVVLAGWRWWLFEVEQRRVRRGDRGGGPDRRPAA